jgi:hypothetical protein
MTIYVWVKLPVSLPANVPLVGQVYAYESADVETFSVRMRQDGGIWVNPQKTDFIPLHEVMRVWSIAPANLPGPAESAPPAPPN